MSPLAVNLDLELLAERREHTLTISESAGRCIGVDVKRDHGRYMLHGAGGDHLGGPLANLLGGLENGSPRRGAGQTVAALPECQGRSQGHRRMGVVAAGVHHALPGRAVGHCLGIVDPQGVDIRANRGNSRPVIPFRSRDDPPSRGCDRVGDARLVELFRQEPRRLVLLPARLGMGVEPAANFAKHPPPFVKPAVDHLRQSAIVVPTSMPRKRIHSTDSTGGTCRLTASKCERESGGIDLAELSISRFRHRPGTDETLHPGHRRV